MTSLLSCAVSGNSPFDRFAVCEAFYLSGESEDAVTTKKIEIPEEKRQAFWLLKLDEPGNYRITVTDEEGGHIVSETVRIRAIRSRDVVSCSWNAES